MYHSLRTVHTYTTLDLSHRKFVVKYIPALPSAWDISDHKLPMTEVKGSIYSEYTWRLWYIY